MKFIYSIPKPLFFGFVGALGCLVGWLLGEPLLLTLKSKGKGKDAAQEQQSAVLLFGNEFRERQVREGAKSGDVQLTLIWNNINDIDLHCINPAGEHIYFRNTNAPHGGTLDVDMNARQPYSDKPVENIFFPTNGAPLGTYQVLVNHYSNKGAPDPTPYKVAVKANGEIKEYSGSLSYGSGTNLVCTFEVAPPKPKSTMMETGLAAKMAWKPTLVIGCWTAILAISLSFGLVMGQNQLMRRQLMSGPAALRLLRGGLLAGLISGAVSQYLFSVGAQVLFAGNQNLNGLLKTGQVVGWMSMGLLLGWGLAFFIPNLPKSKAAAAGLLGGLLGGVAFLLATGKMGELAGRMMGSALLGVSIGCIVAIMERLAREAALVVHWDENERTIINLGPDPVILGSSPEAHLYLPAEKGFPAETAIVVFVDGRVEMENLMTETKHTLYNGNKLEIGNLVIEIQTDSQS